MLKRSSLTVSMLLATLLLGLLLWIVSDRYQSEELSKIFYSELNKRFDKNAREQRLRFDLYVKSHLPGAKMYARNADLKAYLQSEQWQENQHQELKSYTAPPVWLPSLSVLRRFVLPRYAMLIDEQGRIREMYRYKHPMPPDEIVNISPHLLELTTDENFITMAGGKPYLVTSVFIPGAGKTRLMIASPVDEEFLEASQGVSATNSIIAILKDEETRILVSNRSKLIPAGSELSELQKTYLLTGEGYFDSGSSDILIKLVSFISTAEAHRQTEMVLDKERSMWAFTVMAYIIVFSILIYWITSRIKYLTNKVVQFSEDMDIQQPSLIHADEIEKLESRFELLASAIRSETRALEHQALHDPLTNMPNRKLFNQRIQHELHSSINTHQPFIVMVTDLNRFKEINDALGHHIGDKVLQKVSEVLQNSLRACDTVARLGGDEFGMLLPNSDIKHVISIVSKLLYEFEEPFHIDDYNFDIGLSIGVVEYPTHGHDINILLQRADIAMYHAKNHKLGFSIYQESDDTNSLQRLALINDLKKSLDDGSLQVYYQPKAELATGRICGAEALLRWQHPMRGYISPDEFIILAEQTGMIHKLTYWVIDRAIRECSKWHQQGYPVSVSINTSVYSIQDNDLVNAYRDALQKHKLPPTQCIIEITESAFIRDPLRARKILNQLSDIGITVSIDDFGTGYSSMAYLKQMPVTEIKIDRSFVREMLDDENDAIIVKATIELAHNLGMKVVAEGVENTPILNKLTELGCDEVQGYQVSRPLPAEDFIQLLSTSNSKGNTVIKMEKAFKGPGKIK